MFCSNCGAELPDGKKFCGKCGAKLQDFEVVSNPVQEHLPAQKDDFVSGYNNNQVWDEIAVRGNETIKQQQRPEYHWDNENNIPKENINTGGSSTGSAADQPGKGAAVASLVLGIISVVCWFTGAGSIIGFVTGIIGLICSSSAKKQGFTGGMQTGGFVCSLIGTIVSAFVFVACVACVGTLGGAAFLR